MKKDKSKEIKIGPSESMSKSKKNTIDPENIISQYGADAARLFILSDSPPEKDIQWSEEGILSSFKFVQKLWNLNLKIMEEIKKNHEKDVDNELEKFTNKLIKKVTENLENFSYNKIVANLHEMYTFVSKQIDKSYSKETLHNNYKNILILMCPILPHFANECLEIIGGEKNMNWPECDLKYLSEEKINMVIQINGKKRELISLKKDIEQNELLSLIKNNEKLKKYIDNKKIKKQIFIKNKIINLII